MANSSSQPRMLGLSPQVIALLKADNTSQVSAAYAELCALNLLIHEHHPVYELGLWSLSPDGKRFTHARRGRRHRY